MQFRGGPAAVIGDVGQHRGFPVTLNESHGGEGRRPANDPKARRPDVSVFNASIAVRLGIPMETEPGEAPMEFLRVFFMHTIQHIKGKTP